MANRVLTVPGPLDRSTVGGFAADLSSAVEAGEGPITLDLHEVEDFDSVGMGAIVEGLRKAETKGVEVRMENMSRPLRDLFSLVSLPRLIAPPPAPEKIHPMVKVGSMVEPTLFMVQGIATTARDTLHGLFIAPFQGKRLRFDRVAIEYDHAAGGALPIIALIAFLLGLILAMQAWVQLRVFGAEIYMADMVGVSVLSEIGPLMTSIVLAARSGSSNAAQLGSMKINEEIDALQQMAIHPVRFLVLPKVIALCAAVVSLCLLFDVIAMCGGALFAFLVADIEWNAYATQTQAALKLMDFAVAIAKCLAFGGLIGVVGCALGLRVSGGSEGVGRATTNAVVVSIFLIIVVDAVFVTAQRMLFS